MGQDSQMACMPYDERNDETGRFTPQFGEVDMLNAIEAVDRPTTSEIANEVGCAYRTAYEYLRELEDDGRVERYKIGTTSVWSLATDPDDSDEEN